MGPKLSVALNAYCTMKFEIRFRDSWITRKIRGSFKVFKNNKSWLKCIVIHFPYGVYFW